MFVLALCLLLSNFKFVIFTTLKFDGVSIPIPGANKFIENATRFVLLLINE